MNSSSGMASVSSMPLFLFMSKPREATEQVRFVSKPIGVKDFVCIQGSVKIPTLLDRCNGVLKAFIDANMSVSPTLSDHVVRIEKPLNSTIPTNIQSVADTIRSRSSVTGIVYLSAPVFNELGGQLSNLLNNTRSFRIATFDFNKSMMRAFDQGQLHYSISSLIYMQTLIAILLLYIQVRILDVPKWTSTFT